MHRSASAYPITFKPDRRSLPPQGFPVEKALFGPLSGRVAVRKSFFCVAFDNNSARTNPSRLLTGRFTVAGYMKTAQHITTFVFSDIEHSTRLAQRLRDAYPELLERHRSVIRDAIRRYEGREIDTAGDGFFMTFDRASQAVAAAESIQRAFHTQPWASEMGLKVRMGIHTGLALATAGGFTGVEVHRASRICNAAHGGQVLLSSATRECLEEEKLPGTAVSPLGAFVLKDFADPVELFQLNISGVPQAFPQPRIEPDEKRLAVIPFTNLSNRKEHEYIGDGMAEELIIALGKVRGLRVVSRSTAFAVKKGGLPAQEIGRKLHVNSVLEGRVRAINGHMRISVELVDAESGLNLWSGQYDSAEEDLLRIQEEITRQVSESMDCKLQPEQLDSLQHRQTHNAEAYDFYLRGRRFYAQFSTRGIELALRMFERAIEADPDYALAYAGMADCYSYQYQHIERSPEVIDRADEMSRKSIERDPTLAEARVSRGIVLSLRLQYEQAEQSFLYAIERDPTLFLGWFHYGRTCFIMGKLDKAARLFEQANRVEPEDYQSILLAAQTYADLGSTELARALRRRGAAIAERFLEFNPGDTRALYMAANALVFLDQREKSLRLLQRALSLDPGDSMLLYNAGCIYALLGMKEEALNCLEASYRAGLTLKGWYENDSNLDSIRDEARFQQLLRQMTEEQETG